MWVSLEASGSFKYLLIFFASFQVVWAFYYGLLLFPITVSVGKLLASQRMEMVSAPRPRSELSLPKFVPATHSTSVPSWLESDSTSSPSNVRLTGISRTETDLASGPRSVRTPSFIPFPSMENDPVPGPSNVQRPQWMGIDLTPGPSNVLPTGNPHAPGRGFELPLFNPDWPKSVTGPTKLATMKVAQPLVPDLQPDEAIRKKISQLKSKKELRS